MHTSRAVLAGLAAGAVLAAGCGSTTTKQADRPAPAASTAAKLAVVPNLVGVEQSAAHRIAARSGFDMRWLSYVGRLSNGHTNVKCVKVFSQSPVAGERRPVGARIAVFEIACHTPTGKWHDAAGVPESQTQ